MKPHILAASMIDTRPNNQHAYFGLRGGWANIEGLAQVVAEHIIRYGISSSRIIVEAEGEGESSPVASNKTAIDRAGNRRVEIKFEKIITEEVINNGGNG